MSTIELSRSANAKAPPGIAVTDAQFAALGLLNLAERAVRLRGPLVTLTLPGGRRLTVLAGAAHAALWHERAEQFHKNVDDPASGVAMTRAVLGPTLLTSRAGPEWQEMRREMTRFLGLSKTWFLGPLAEATEKLISDLIEGGDVPLLEHCIAWAIRAICEPLIWARALDAVSRDLVHQLNASFLGMLSKPGSGPDCATLAHCDTVMRRIALEHGPDSIAAHVLKQNAGHAGCDVVKLRATVGGLLAASLHINALSLFWALVQIAERPDLQETLCAEAAPWGLAPRRVADTPFAFACIREAQRLRPVMAFIERQVAHGIEIDGHELPAGETVLFSPYLVQRGADWGNALHFNPAHFAPGTRHAPESFFPFGLGPRMCPGTNLVNQQLTFALSSVTGAVRLAPDPATRAGDLVPMFRVNLEPRGRVCLHAAPR